MKNAIADINDHRIDDNDIVVMTDPMEIGVLFATSWNTGIMDKKSVKNENSLKSNLLEYYMECGYDSAKQLRKVLLGAAARGDVEGMKFILSKKKDPNDVEVCTVAGAAGRLEALKWLREDQNFAWDATDLYREASENSHDHVMSYVEVRAEEGEIQTHYGVGLPW
jgi:hypothetical protein